MVCPISLRSSFKIVAAYVMTGFPGGASGKESACQCKRRERCGFDPWVGKIPWVGRIPMRISMDRGAWRAAVQGVAKSRTQLKRLNHTTHTSWLQFGYHGVNFFHLSGVSVSTRQLTGYSSEYCLQLLRRN